MQAGWERWQALDNSNLGKEKRWGALPQLPWVPKCFSLSPARDQGAEHRCAGRRVKAVSACESKCGARVTAQPPRPPTRVCSAESGSEWDGWSGESALHWFIGTFGAAPALKLPWPGG